MKLRKERENLIPKVVDKKKIKKGITQKMDNKYF